MGIILKHCHKCNTTKPLDDFHRNKKRSDGRAVWCKVCMSDYGRKRRNDDPGYMARYYQANKEHIAKAVHDYYEANRDNYHKYNREYYQENKQAMLDYQQQYYADNADSVKNQQKIYRKENRGRLNTIRRNYINRKRGAGGSYTAEEWQALCEQYNNRCACCGKKTKLTADHVVPIIAGGNNDISNIQPLCGPCNSSKGTKSTDYR